MAHELAHVKNRHMLVGTIAASMAGAVMLIGSILRWGAIFGGFGGRDRRGGGLEMLALAILAPIAAMLVQMAISRRNEFEADAGGARDQRQAAGAGAARCRRSTSIAQHHPMQVSPSAAHLAIINPLARDGRPERPLPHPPAHRGARRSACSSSPPATTWRGSPAERVRPRPTPAVPSSSSTRRPDRRSPRECAARSAAHSPFGGPPSTWWRPPARATRRPRRDARRRSATAPSSRPAATAPSPR